MSGIIQVNQWQAVNKQLLWAYRGNVAPHFRDAWVQGYHYTLWFLISGSVTVTTSSRSVTATRGEGVLLPPCDHRQHFESTTDLLSIRFLLNGPAGYPLLDFDHPLILNGDIAELLKHSDEMVREIKRTFDSPRNNLHTATGSVHDHLQAEHLFATFLDKLLVVLEGMGVGLHRLEKMDDRVLECVRRVQKAKMDHRWTEADMASMIGLSPVQLNRLFQESLGMTSYAWLDSYRLSQAHQLLQTNQRIKEISFSLGFSSPQHFSTWFKRKTGRTPGEARRAASGPRPER